ncbi:LysE/ArgO family amino acid transporter [Selenihalanaerobacter shriftii]|uniref:L-lysine exporter family protein LysE/ArgO n=1 Tax=Selenihalanaerobacter shriftii TaxID=142842 RepID=A0A1T4QSZ0_9FIRM|nr:LysE family transporter [Selenihalanaerobacter shriftii]SKA06903.1 L-lysine exporter family protein LysE/ArgO [Selenihalanaerobacter shriftii]
MYNYLIQGLFLGLAYVAPIGMQNLYVINTAMKGNKIKTYQVALVTIFFDITLALACFFGIGLLIENVPILKSAILLVGSILVMHIGISLVRSSSDVRDDVKVSDSIIKIITTSFIVTWLNPQAVIDGSLLLGSYQTSIPVQMSKYFILGFSSASFIWFIFISTITLILRDKLNNSIVKGINIICGIILIFFGVKLGYSFIQIING